MQSSISDWRGEHLIRAPKVDRANGPRWTYEQLRARREKMKGLVEQGLSKQEIADQLGISKNAVYSELSRLKAGEI